ncbi:hypothetical protein FHR81_005459 [Actinoalloteichus hoggarensis]|uniref:hypothetical protein n=1 Tax=Actinoalloteichus hoggarensis TaxID=1470176 RepID=UPI0012FE1240|nr:hypothetical protein [Actinoalloteichus hoggarensis]MBB5924382.1 hypothetical protein [Actinoalloteichus hoggarensis]
MAERASSIPFFECGGQIGRGDLEILDRLVDRPVVVDVVIDRDPERPAAQLRYVPVVRLDLPSSRRPE